MKNVTFEHTLRQTLCVPVHKSGHDRVCGERLSFHGHKVIRNRPALGVKSENDQIYFALLEDPADAEKFTGLMDSVGIRHWFPSAISFRPCDQDMAYFAEQPSPRDIDIQIQESDSHSMQVHKRGGDYMNRSVIYFALDPDNPKKSMDELRSIAKDTLCHDSDLSP